MKIWTVTGRHVCDECGLYKPSTSKRIFYQLIIGTTPLTLCPLCTVRMKNTLTDLDPESTPKKKRS